MMQGIRYVALFSGFVYDFYVRGMSMQKTANAGNKD